MLDNVINFLHLRTMDAPLQKKGRLKASNPIVD